MARTAYLATMAARLKADDVAKMRHMSVRSPKPQPEPAQQQIPPAIITFYLVALLNQFLNYMTQIEHTTV